MEAVWGDNVSHPKNYTKVKGTWLCGFPSKIYPGILTNIKSEAKVKEGGAGFKCHPRVMRRLGR